MHCTCPGKIMLAGEYAVVHGGPAVLVAVNARASARLAEEEQELSPFLQELERCLADRFGEASDEAMAVKRVQVDTSAFRQDSTKLGLGSSAAATVAALGAALAKPGQTLDLELMQNLASAAHAQAQAKLGAKGSGADIATCIAGGALRFQKDSEQVSLRSLTLPSDLHLVFPWTGVAAATGPLVARVQDFRARQPEAYRRLAQQISVHAEALAEAKAASGAVDAIAAGGVAIQRLAEAAGVELWLPMHSKLARLAAHHGGALKPTGAGAGDLAVAAFAGSDAAAAYRKSLLEQGILCPALDVDSEGVRLQA